MKPLAIDLFCGLGGWSQGLLAEGWQVVGFDIEAHDYGDGKRYPCQLVLQDVLTIHGRQFKDASLIVVGPPCQEYSYMAMPWSRAKRLQGEYRTGQRDRKKLTALFDACFRIQREAIAVAGHFIPLVVENVRGAQPWVGRARWNFGSYYLWGDVPALMPITNGSRMKFPAQCGPRLWSERDYQPLNDGNVSSFHHEGRAREVQRLCDAERGVKSFTPNGEPLGKNTLGRKHGSKSKSRKAASAMIAKIPLPLARWIGKVYHPQRHQHHLKAEE